MKKVHLCGYFCISIFFFKTNQFVRDSTFCSQQHINCASSWFVTITVIEKRLMGIFAMCWEDGKGANPPLTLRYWRNCPQQTFLKIQKSVLNLQINIRKVHITHIIDLFLYAHSFFIPSFTLQIFLELHLYCFYTIFKCYIIEENWMTWS